MIIATETRVVFQCNYVELGASLVSVGFRYVNGVELNEIFDVACQ